MRKLLRPIITVVLSLLFISTVLYGYWGQFEYMYELTFLSNLITGIFLLVVAVLQFKGKKVPQILYLNFTTILLLVFIVCMAFINDFKFSGAFIFLHVLNPIFLLVYYFVFCNMNDTKRVISVLSVTIMPLLYLIFAVVYGQVTGNYIYFFLNVEEKGYLYCSIFILIVALFQLIIGYGGFYLNRLIFMKRRR